MADAGQEFKGALLKFQADTDDAVDLIVRGVAQYALGQVIQRSPVGNPDLWEGGAPPGYVGGRFKGNWQASVDKPIETAVPNVDPSGAATITAGTTAIMAPNRPREFWLTNNLPYSERLESGWSRQAPAGIVAVTMADIGGAFDQSAAQALSEKGLS